MQKTTGVHSILNVPFIYRFSQFLFSDPNAETKLQKLCKTSSNSVVYDIGCGTGAAISYINPECFYYGFDISADYIKRAAELHSSRKNTLFVNDEFNQNSSKQIKNCDLLIMMGVMHHISDENLSRLFQNIFDKMNKSGRLITIDPVFLAEQRPISKFLISNDRGKAVRNEEHYKSVVSQYFQISSCEVISQKFPPYDRCLIGASKTS